MIQQEKGTPNIYNTYPIRILCHPSVSQSSYKVEDGSDIHQRKKTLFFFNLDHLFFITKTRWKGKEKQY